ncbi:MAG: serine/threonine-protein kinase [Isosphaeraceae bacterium]
MNQSAPDLRAIFGQALELESPADRDRFLAQACGENIEMRREVEGLLKSLEQASGFLESPAVPPLAIETSGIPIAPCTVIGPYILREPIGEGGMGVVYVAEQDEPVRRRVALKVIKPGMDTKQVIARFDMERQTLALMDHPNIARVLDAGSTESGRPYFVMELVRGQPITDYCDEARLSIPERLELFVLVCRAVQHAHQKGIIHRDLKPSNVLVTVIDGVAVPKVIDFGIAKATGPALTDKTLYTAFTQLIGTPLYMSPEQVELSGVDVDTRSDIYSLGVLLYELLTGTTPFDARTLRRVAFDEMRRMIREDEPPSPSTRLSSLGETLTTTSLKRSSDPRKLSRTVRGELDWIAMKALEKDRTRRYETASDFAADVLRYLTTRPIEAGPPSARYRLEKFARRNRGAITMATVLASALGLATAFSSRQALLARRAEGDALLAWKEEAQRRHEVEQERNRAIEAEKLALNNEKEANRSKSDSQAFSDFLVHDVLAVARPRGVQGGLGVGVTVAEALEAAEATLEKRFAGRPLAEAIARDAIGKTWRNLAKFEHAERHLRRAVELREKELGPEDPATLDSRNSLGVLLGQMGRVHEAIELHQQTLKIQQSRLGNDHRDTLISMHNLAGAYQDAGQFDRALLLHQQTLERRKTHLGPEDPETLASMADLACTYGFLGQPDQALPLLVQTLELQKTKLGPDHQNTLKTMSNLAWAYANANKVSMALPLFKQVLEKQSAILGPNDPDTIATKCNLATAYSHAGRLTDAEPLVRAAVDGARLTYGPDHPQILPYMNEQARVNWLMRRFSESVSLYEESLRLARKHKGDDDLVTLVTAYNLAANYRDAGRLADAERLIAAWLPRGIAKLGLRNPYSQYGVETTLSIHERLKQHAKAEPLLREMARLTKAVAGADSPKYAQQLASLGRNLLEQKKSSDAEPILRECLEILEKTRSDDFTTFNTRSLLGASLLGQARYAEAEPELLAGFEGMVHHEEGKARLLELLEAKRRIVRLYDAWGRREKADSWRRKLPATRPAKPVESKSN